MKDWGVKVVGTNDDPNKLKVQLEVLKERLRYLEKRDNLRLKYLEERNDLQKKEIEQHLISLERKEIDLQKLTEEKIELKIAFEVERQKTKHLEEIVVQNKKKQGGKTVNTRVRGFSTSILFLIASILAGFGINMLTSMPPNSEGWLPIAMSIIAYIIATLLTTFLASEGENE